MKNNNAVNQFYMRKALALAKQGLGFTSPNPPVGAIIVRNEQITGKGFHQKAGEPHAEILALQDAGQHAEGATMYVTLEPCCHQGKTPPCTTSLIRAGIKKVVIGSIDPHKAVNCQGIQELQNAGLEVITGVLKEKTDYLLRFFQHFIQYQRPYITLKLALSLDGKIAAASKESKWITGDLSRKYVHALRRQHDAVMVGTNTILIDNPSLTVRNVRQTRQPHKIILDLKGRIPLHFNCFGRAEQERIFVIMGKSVPDYIKKEVSSLPAEVLEVEDEMPSAHLFPTIFHMLGKKGITSILVEGGSQLAGTLIENELVEELNFFMAPIIIGEGMPAISGWGVKSLQNAPRLNIYKVTPFRQDYLFKAHFIKK